MMYSNKLLKKFSRKIMTQALNAHIFEGEFIGQYN